ncbi:MAG: UDP-4-amino-4,6-dideoxy-N-acetyl-beta-L-altrosamine transaminase [Cyanobacteria bacterium P01_H01_bin.74]
MSSQPSTIQNQSTDFIPYGRQSITPEDIAAVTRVLSSNYLTQGPAIAQFEAALAQSCGAAHAVAVSSATSALHLACLALGVSPGDWVWTSPISFVASANCALYCGAQIDFVDIDPKTYNLSIDALTQKLTVAQKNNTLPKVIIPVHLAGQSCDMAAIHELSKTYGFRVIEDASHAIGGQYQDQPVGACQYSDLTVFSFHPVKIITTGEGGAVLTQSAALAEKVQELRMHGITRDARKMQAYNATDNPPPPWYYEQRHYDHPALGINARMTDIQAALGSSQLTRLSAMIVRRHQIAETYTTAFAPYADQITCPWQLPESYSAYHLYIIRLKNATEAYHRTFFESLRAANIGVNLHYIPIYRHPYYQQHYGYNGVDFPKAECYYREAISLPMFYGLTDEQQARVIETVCDLVKRLN